MASEKFNSIAAPGLTLWANIEQGKISFSVKKRYKNKDDQWTDSKVLFAQDLTALACLIPVALHWAQQQRENKGGDNGQQQEQEFKPTNPPSDDDDIPF